MNWVADFIDWHLRTEHPWPPDAQAEAMHLLLMAGLRQMMLRWRIQMLNGAGIPNYFTGLRHLFT